MIKRAADIIITAIVPGEFLYSNISSMFIPVIALPVALVEEAGVEPTSNVTVHHYTTPPFAGLSPATRLVASPLLITLSTTPVLRSQPLAYRPLPC